jgi:predicted lipid-binding transport protein (Tim44 family)
MGVLSRLRSRLKERRQDRRLRRRTPAPQEVDAFLDAARRSFVSLQQAWDRADLATLATVATEPLFEELRCQLEERGPLPNHTEVLRVEARLLGVEQLREAQVASVEFSGLIREQRDARAQPFRELWMLARLAGADRGWQVARVQALS